MSRQPQSLWLYETKRRRHDNQPYCLLPPPDQQRILSALPLEMSVRRMLEVVQLNVCRSGWKPNNSSRAASPAAFSEPIIITWGLSSARIHLQQQHNLLSTFHKYVDICMYQRCRCCWCARGFIIIIIIIWTRKTRNDVIFPLILIYNSVFIITRLVSSRLLRDILWRYAAFIHNKWFKLYCVVFVSIHLSIM